MGDINPSPTNFQGKGLMSNWLHIQLDLETLGTQPIIPKISPKAVLNIFERYDVMHWILRRQSLED